MSGKEKRELAARLYFKYDREFDRVFPTRRPKSIIALLRNLHLSIATEFCQNDEELKEYCLTKIREMYKANLLLK